MNLSILYRGPLSSCNYGCEYCPFAKHHETQPELQHDAHALSRFTDWVARQSAHTLSILFTPWGEALIRPWYQDALARLTNLPHVPRAAIQTNLSCRLDWTDRCDPEKLALWCTYHPGETTREKFLAKCRDLDRRHVRYSVGVVGLKEHLPEIEHLRQQLRPDVYLWVNAYKRQSAYYTPEDLTRLNTVDPLFPLNNTHHPSLGKDCHTGHSVISVSGDGTIRRCHFIKTELGNIYTEGWEQSLHPRPCTNQSCGCHIGYIHMPSLNLHQTFGQGLLERIPTQIPPTPTPLTTRHPLPILT